MTAVMLGLSTRVAVSAPDQVVLREPRVVEMSDHAAMMEENTMSANATSIKAVTLPLNQITSPYAFSESVPGTRGYESKCAHNQNYGKVLKYGIYWYA